MALCLWGIVTLLPLILAPNWLLYYDVTPKIVVLAAGTAVAALLMMREAPVRSLMLRAFGILLAAEGAWLAVSTAMSKDPALSLGGSGWRRYGLITHTAVLLLAWIVAQHAMGRPDRVRQLLRAIVAAGIPAAIYGILQYFGWDPLINPGAYRIGEAPLTIVRPPGTLGYASYFATYLLSVIFAGAALALAEESRIWRLVGMGATFVATAALILTGTRAAILGLICAAVMLAVWLRPRIRIPKVTAGVAAIAVLAGFYFSPAGQALRNRTLWSMGDRAGGARPLLWRDTIRMAAARWLVGFGPETFSIWFPRYQSAELARAYPAFYQESPHNIFLDALADEGVPGAVILIVVTALGFHAAWKARDSKAARALGTALAALVVSQQFTAFTAPTAAFYYITIALLVAEAPGAERVSRERHVAGRLIAAVLASVVLLLFASTLLYADAQLKRIEDLSGAGRIREAIAAYQQVERWRPPGMRTDLWYSGTMARAARHVTNAADGVAALQQALEAAQRAAGNAEERENAWLNLAVFYGRQNDFPRTEQSLRAAIACAPNSYKSHWLLAEVLWTGRQLNEASAEAEKAVYLDGGKNPEVVRTLMQIRAAAQNSQPRN